ncbi:hypothetical protein J6590_086219 [Homalodisca vitripennis]|nr:hypothetical protein J6590_104119 [Homalodisca vitripennis]KAG8314723.1 hypothetical protein J6590_086219 [Homalodisca vitripennis]
MDPNPSQLAYHRRRFISKPFIQCALVVQHNKVGNVVDSPISINNDAEDSQRAQTLRLGVLTYTEPSLP